MKEKAELVPGTLVSVTAGRHKGQTGQFRGVQGEGVAGVYQIMVAGKVCRVKPGSVEVLNGKA